MKRLITPTEVVVLAFRSSAGIDGGSVSEAAILSAEQKFVKPVLNALYEKLQAGDYPDLLENYVKPALAQYVRFLLLPELAVSVGSMGIVSLKGGCMSPADSGHLNALRKRARGDANAFMRRAVEHIEQHGDLYPEYDPSANILKRRSVVSQIVL